MSADRGSGPLPARDRHLVHITLDSLLHPRLELSYDERKAHYSACDAGLVATDPLAPDEPVPYTLTAARSQ